MYMTRAILNPRCNRETALALLNIDLLHKAVTESVSETQREKAVWRLDKDRDDYKLLIVSEKCPKLEKLQKYLGYIPDFQSKNYNAVIRDETRFRFRLSANPTKRNFATRKKEGISNVEKQVEWLKNKGAQNGFEVLNILPPVSSYVTYKKGTTKINLLRVDYDGILAVRDSEKFKTALYSGIGRQKSFGMGLLTIMRT